MRKEGYQSAKDFPRGTTEININSITNDEIEKLLDRAYNEGFSQGMREYESYKGGYGFQDSKTYRKWREIIQQQQ